MTVTALQTPPLSSHLPPHPPLPHPHSHPHSHPHASSHSARTMPSQSMMLHLLHMHLLPRISAHMCPIPITTTLHLLPRPRLPPIRRRERHAVMRFIDMIALVRVRMGVEPTTAGAGEILVGAGARAARTVACAVVVGVDARRGRSGRPLILLGKSVAGGGVGREGGRPGESVGAGW